MKLLSIKAIIDAGGSDSDHKLRSVERLVNKGLLGEFLKDDGATWFTKQDNFNKFIAALGSLGDGLTVKKWSHPVIAYYVPLHLNISNLASTMEIESVNGIQPGELQRVQWAKPPNRCSAKQICGHLILTFSELNAANRAKEGDLVICNKRVSVSKYKRKPIRCLKCQHWNHIASECIRTTDLCGTCSEEGHRTSVCEATGKQFCISCKTNDHPSWARHCPTFTRKCKEFDQKHPENSLPFYPSQEPWSWAQDLPKPKQRLLWTSTLQIPVQQRAGTQRLCQQQLRFPKAPPKVTVLTAPGKIV